MLHKTLTVVVPTYNMEKYLRRCLDSLIVGEEGMAQLEVLVVNDGSKDSSSAIAHEYEARYADTFRVIDKENGHYGSCVNRGVEEARGRYIKILDADDCYDNAEFEKYVDTIKTVDVDMVLNDYAFIRPDGEIAGIRRYNYRGGNSNSIRVASRKCRCMLWHTRQTICDGWTTVRRRASHILTSNGYLPLCLM